MKTMLHRLLFIALFVIFALGCTKDDNVPTTPPVPNPEESTADKVETLFEGKIALLTNGGEQIVGFLQKRFPNILTEITTDTHAVLLNEESSATILSGDERLDAIVSLWKRGSAAIFVNPGKNALQLVAKLNAMLAGSEPTAITDEVAASFKDIVIMVIKADGDALLCNTIGSQKKVYNATAIIKDAEDAEAIEEIFEPKEEIINVIPTDYQMGRLAERVSAWLNHYYNADAQPLHSAFGETRGDEENSYSALIDFFPVIAVKHNMGDRYDWCDIKDCPKTDYVDALVRISVISGWNETAEKDVYDITIMEGFDATNSYHTHVLIAENAAYNYRYSGGYYYGPTVNSRLKTNANNFTMENNSTIYSPVPVAEAGSYTVTHDPGSTTLGGSVSIAGGSSGVMVTGSFNFSITLPKTVVAVSEADMPVNHETNYFDYIIWDYRSTFIVEQVNWGTNPDYQDPPYITRSNCELTQAATYAVGNSHQLGDTPVYLDCTVAFKTHHELAQPEIILGTSHIQENIDHIFDVPLCALPIVKRFSERYEPVCRYNSGDINSWVILQTVLVRNANYNAFNEGYKICAATEPGVAEAAKGVWKETVEDLVEINKAHDANEEFVIMLKDESNEYLPMALHINGNVWEVVEDGNALLETLNEKLE